MSEKEEEDWRAWPPPLDYRGLRVTVELEDGTRTWANRYDEGKWHIREESPRPVRWKPSKEFHGMTA